MTPERWQRMESLYDAAAELDAAERARFLVEQCADDEDLRRELEAMFDGSGSDFTGVVAGAAAAAFEQSDRWTGRRMGPYRIVRAIGHGGMGAVFLAVRDDDEYKKEVAVKTLKFDAGDPALLSRFRHERQILAHLEHPNVARLLDGGTTPEGTPYIVLEYVDGVPINKYCEEQHLSIEQRLKLFRQVCDAVQYAHRHLIVHRDIKPGNILVTAEGVPKLLDFGIAKLLDPSAEAVMATATGMHAMTLDYASPEQVRGETITIATDVYSLGAVLFQVLTRQRPHGLQTYSPTEVDRVICQTETRPPSSYGDRHLRGELDNIVLKAMQKDPARRYTSVEQFSEDIRRYLEGLPVIARPDTASYRVTKFVRRHSIGVGSIAAVLLALLGGVAVSLREQRIAERHFAQVRELANTFLFQFYDQVTPLPGSVAVRASIVETARKYLDGLAKDAGKDKDLILELAQAYTRLGDIQGRPGDSNAGNTDQARANYLKAIDLYDRLPVTKQSPPNLRRHAAYPMYMLSRLEFQVYHDGKAEPLNQRALDLLGGSAQDNATRSLHAVAERSLGEIRLHQGRSAEAVALTESALHTLQDLKQSGFAGADGPIQDTMERLAKTKTQTGDLDGALSTFEDLLRNAKPCDPQTLPGNACRTLVYRFERLGDIYGAVGRPNLGEPQKAAAFYLQSIPILERLAAADREDRQARYALASNYGKLGDVVWRTDPKRALELYERALTTAQALASKDQFKQLKESYLQAIIHPLTQLGRTVEARQAFEEINQSADPPVLFIDLISDIELRSSGPGILWAEGKHEAAVSELRDVLRQLDKLRGAYPHEFHAVFDLCQYYRQLAAWTTGEEHRQALLRSADTWQSWPPTSFTRREEEKDRQAAK